MEKRDANLLGYSIFSSKSLSAWKKFRYYPSKVPKRLSQVTFVVSGDVGEASIIYPTVVSLKKRYPKTVVWVYTDRFNAPLFEDCVWVDKVRVVPVERWKRLHWADSVSEAQKWIRKNSPEMGWVYSFSTEPVFSLLARLLGGEKVIGLVMDEDGAPAVVGNRWMQMFCEIRAPLLSDTVFARMDVLPLSLLCVWAVGLDFNVSDADLILREKVPSGVCPTWEKDVIAMSWQVGSSAKQWNGENWRRLAQLIEEKMDVEVWFVGIKDWISPPAEISGVKVIMCEDVLEWAYIVKRCKALISVDNGLMHIAGMGGVPVLVLCGSKVSLPVFGANHIGIRRDVPCAPCWLDVCEKRYCMDDIDVDVVIKVLLEGFMSNENLCRLSSDLDVIIEKWSYLGSGKFPIKRTFSAEADNLAMEVALFIAFLSLWNEIGTDKGKVSEVNFCEYAREIRQWCRDEKLFMSGVKLQINDLRSWEQRLSLLIMRLQELFPQGFPMWFSWKKKAAIDLVNLWNSLLSFDEAMPRLLVKLLTDSNRGEVSMDVRRKIVAWVSEKRFLLKMIRKYHSCLKDLVFENDSKSGRIKQ